MQSYSNGTYSVTVNSDRSIKVKPGDWISKYSAAIFNQPKANWGNYKRKVNGSYVDIPPPHQLIPGELIYYVGDLPNWTGPPSSSPPGVVPPTPPPDTDDGLEPPSPNRVIDFLNWTMQTLCPISDWSVVGSNDLGGGILLQAQLFQLGLKHVSEDKPRWFSAAGGGVGVSPWFVKAGATWSSTWYSDGLSNMTGLTLLNGGSFVAKCVTAGPELTPREFSGSFIRFDIGASFAAGPSASVIAVGLKDPAEVAIRKLLQDLAGHGEFSWAPFAPMAIIYLAGVNAGFDAGVSVKAGRMWEASSHFGNYI